MPLTFVVGIEGVGEYHNVDTWHKIDDRVEHAHVAHRDDDLVDFKSQQRRSARKRNVL